MTNTRPTPGHSSYGGMIARCYSTNNPKYPRYGGRGIKVCERWRKGFRHFLADMGTPPGPGYSIDRIDNDGDYEPGNCRWATPQEQVRNRSTSPYVEVNGEMVHLMDAVGNDKKAYHAAITNIYRGRPWNAPKGKMARLTETQAGEIKWLLNYTDSSFRDVAVAYGISDGMARNIASEKQWANAKPIPCSQPPKSVTEKMAPYILAMEDWATPSDVAVRVHPYSKGHLLRLVKAGLATTHDGKFKATDEAVASARKFRVKTCP